MYQRAGVGAQHADDATEAVKERHGHANLVRRGQRQALSKPIAIIEDIAARQHHALGKARGS